MSIDDITETPPDRIPLTTALRMIDYGEMVVVTTSETKNQRDFRLKASLIIDS